MSMLCCFKNIIFFIVTVFGVGKIKFAPGTFGSLVAFPLSFLIFQATAFLELRFDFDGFSSKVSYLLTIPIVIFIASIKFFFIGWWASALYIKGKEDHDPSEIVIDEVAGQMLVIALTLPSLPMVLRSNIANNFSSAVIEFLVIFLLPFLLFRLFDIVKPWPIRNIERNFPNAFGVMIDDIVAALFAVVIHYAIILCVLDFK
jgi:phosphatidylglycerophosphatase A